jgi:tetratricopeptide (TPR) repeat protein
MRIHATIAALLFGFMSALSASAQVSPADRERATIQNRLGWENMRAEEFQQAVKAFQLAVEIDPEYDYAYYGLGRAHMALKEYPSAISALKRCKDVHVARAGRSYANVQDAQRARNDRIIQIDEQIRMVQSMPQNVQRQDELRQLQNTRRDVQEAIQRGTTAGTLHATVPSYVTLSLGSAYFRAGQMADAEREYLATIQADSRTGEAHNNLAVVYLMTGRYGDADRSLAAAKKVGFRVNPNLEADIKAKKKAGSW